MPVAEKKSMAKAASLSNDNSGPNRVTGMVARTRDFLKDVRAEMRKVVTPTRSEVQSTTIVVLVTVFAFAGFFYVVDSVLDHALRVLLHWLGSV
jgi:preprotein translocase subunit SecE